MHHHVHIAELLARHFLGNMTEQEQRELNEWLNASPDNHEQLKLFSNRQWVNDEIDLFNSFDLKSARHRASRKIRRLKWRSRLRWGSRLKYAYIFLAVALISGYFWWNSGKEAAENTVATVNTTNRSEIQFQQAGKDFLIIKGDIFLKGMTAVKVDTIIDLEKIQNGYITRQGNLEFSKQGKRIVYKEIPNSNMTSSIQTKLVTSWGSQYQIQLPDSSQIWLNTRSSVSFSVGNSKEMRIVELKGEAYFKVKKVLSRPFLVMVNGAEVEVLGTRFNINAYEEEGRIKTSLLQGKIKLKSEKDSKVLTPGQSAYIDSIRVIEVVDDDNIEQTIAWTEDVFSFDGDSVTHIIRQFERWYNVKINYLGTSSDLTTARINRSKPVDSALNTLFKDKMQIIKNGREINLIPLTDTVQPH